MPLYRDEGVVLRTTKLGEADRIVTLLDGRITSDRLNTDLSRPTVPSTPSAPTTPTTPSTPSAQRTQGVDR